MSDRSCSDSVRVGVAHEKRKKEEIRIEKVIRMLANRMMIHNE
jgi:hypothetical protein